MAKIHKGYHLNMNYFQGKITGLPGNLPDIPMEELFHFHIGRNKDNQLIWLPVFYSKLHPEIYADVSKLKTADFTQMIIVGCVESFVLQHFSNLNAVMDFRTQVDKSFFNAFRKVIKNDKAKMDDFEKPFDNIEWIEEWMLDFAIRQNQFPNIPKTKFIPETDTMIKDLVTRLVTLSEFDKESFYDFFFQDLKEETHMAFMEHYGEDTTYMTREGQYIKTIDEGEYRVQLDRMLDRKKIRSNFSHVFSNLQDEPMKEIIISDSTGVCCLLFSAIVSSLMETCSNTVKAEVTYAYQEQSEEIRNCVGTDDLGKFLKTGIPQNTGGETYFFHGYGPKLLVSKYTIINEMITQEFCNQGNTRTFYRGVLPTDYFSEENVFYVLRENFIFYACQLYKTSFQHMARNNSQLKKEIETLQDASEKEEIIEETEDIPALTSEIESLKQTILKKDSAIFSKNEQIATLKKEMETLQRQIKELKKNPAAVSEQKEEKSDLPSQEEMVAFLNQYQIFFVGGRWQMDDTLKEKYGMTNLIQLTKDSHRCNFPSSPDYVCFMTQFISHSMYNLVKNNNLVPAENIINYNGTNLNMLIEQLYLHISQKEKDIPEITEDSPDRE